jgi:Tol biopolymer transport system component
MSRTQVRRVAVVMLGLLAVLVATWTWTARGGNSAGRDAASDSRGASISGDGRSVTFVSEANDLVDGTGTDDCDESACFDDVFVRDTRKNNTALVSVGLDGGDANGDSDDPSISGDGRYVAFTSEAGNQVVGDENGQPDVFVRDLERGTTVRVSVDATGGDANGASSHPSISTTGRYVAFTSTAGDLVSADGNNEADVFVRDLHSSVTTRASVDTGGGDPNDRSFGASISGDGRHVAFSSDASDLVPGDGSVRDVFVRDVQAARTTRVSVAVSGGEPDDGVTRESSISGSGRYVAFSSRASDLVADDGNGVEDVFVRDLSAATTTRVSVDRDGGDGDGDSGEVGSLGRVSISEDGRHVAFFSEATDLVPGDTNGVGDVFVRDLQLGTTTRISVDFLGRQVNSHVAAGTSPAISADGRFVAFLSQEDLLVNDTSTGWDVYVHAVPAPTARGRPGGMHPAR